MAGVEVEGARELRRTLRQAAGKEGLADLRAANRSAANLVAGAAKASAPVLDGYLQRSVRAAATPSAGIIRAGNNRRDAAGVRYAGLTHWGWGRRGIRQRPFISNAAQATEPAWLPIYIADMQAAIAKVRGK